MHVQLIRQPLKKAVNTRTPKRKRQKQKNHRYDGFFWFANYEN